MCPYALDKADKPSALWADFVPLKIGQRRKRCTTGVYTVRLQSLLPVLCCEYLWPRGCVVVVVVVVQTSLIPWRLSFGYDGAFLGTTIARASFKKDFDILPADASSISSNITSAFQAGAFFGAIFCFFSRSGYTHTRFQALITRNSHRKDRSKMGAFHF